MSNAINAALLRSLVADLERSNEQIDELNADKSETFKSAKAAGLDVAALRALIAERRRVAKKGAEAVDLADQTLNAYRRALGTDVATRARAREEPPAPASAPSPGGVAPLRSLSAIGAEPVRATDPAMPPFLRRT